MGIHIYIAPLRNKKCTAITEAFQTILDKCSRKPIKYR